MVVEAMVVRIGYIGVHLLRDMFMVGIASAIQLLAPNVIMALGRTLVDPDEVMTRPN